MTPIEFVRPELLQLLPFLLVWWLLVWPRRGGGVLFSRGDTARRVGGWIGIRSGVVLFLPRVLRSLLLVALVVAIAEPYRVEIVRDTTLQGGSINLTLDLSSSMLAVDAEGEGNRLDVARAAAIRFAEGRAHDELSLVAFAGEALTRVPPTTDPRLVVEGVRSLQVQLLRDGTDISTAVLTAVSRLRETEREPRVIVLLTDGAHNEDGVQPLAAARAAAALGVRIHTISVLGPRSAGRSFPPGMVARTEEVETVLTQIAELTGGRYFAASNAASLDSIYAEINRIEVPVERITEREIRHPLRFWPLLAALVILGVEAVFRGSRWGVVP